MSEAVAAAVTRGHTLWCGDLLGRFTEIAESFVPVTLPTLVPSALAVFDVYTAARSMTG